MDPILAVEDGGGDVLWGLADHQGTIRDVVEYDGQQTVLENHVRYDSFGNPTGGTAPIAGSPSLKEPNLSRGSWRGSWEYFLRGSG